MADELDPAVDARLEASLEARLRDVLRHEADALPFSLTAVDLDVARRNRKPAGIRRLGVPASILAAAAAIVIIVVAGSYLRPTQDVGAPTPNPLAADLDSYDDLAKRIALLDGDVIARGEDLVGDTPENGLKETVIGTVPAHDYIDIVFDCRGRSLSFGIRGPNGEFPGGARTCDQRTALSIPTLDVPADLVVIAPRGTVWRLVVAGTPPEATPAPGGLSALPSFEEIAAVASSFNEVARAEGDAQAVDTLVEILKLGDLWNLELAWACIGDGELQVGDTGSSSTSGMDCGDGEPGASAMTLLDTSAARPADAALIATVPAGVAWRLIVFDRSEDLTTGPAVPQAAFPVKVLTTFDGELSPTAPHSEQVGPVTPGATIEVAFGCSTGAFTPTDPPTVFRVTVDGVTRDLACMKSNVAHFVPAGQRVEIGLATDRSVQLALEVRSYTQEQAGATVVVPSATLRTPNGSSSAAGFSTCLRSFSIPGGASADVECVPTPYVIPEARAVRAGAGEVLELVGGLDWAMNVTSITYVPSVAAGNATPGEPLRHPGPDGPGVEGGFNVEPLPEGDWTLRIEISGTLADGTTFTAQQLFRVIVAP